MSQNERLYRTLFGTMASRDKIVAYCRLHRVHMTVKQVETKQCSAKCCRWFKKWDCRYWDRKERIKEVKRIKKEQGIPSWQRVEIRTDHNGNLVPTMRTKKLKKR